MVQPAPLIRQLASPGHNLHRGKELSRSEWTLLCTTHNCAASSPHSMDPGCCKFWPAFYCPRETLVKQMDMRSHNLTCHAMQCTCVARADFTSTASSTLMMSYRRRRGTDSSMAASLSRMRLEVPAAGAPKRAWNFSHSSMSSLLHGGCAALMRLPEQIHDGLSHDCRTSILSCCNLAM